MLLAACVVLAVALCVWGAVGWRRAYRAQAEADRLTRAEQLRDAQLLRIVVSGGEAIAQMALEGISDNVDLPAGAAGDECVPARTASRVDSFVDGAE